ncbi:YceI family protein [Pontibacter sp. G13]|uniref:YceI family protein n=1 Tax=Pontibacter sp. G13 TaxID=3074898 RepID=UPI00288B6AAD|nr:YceI family protein [Pontibacter sp. G13]WNJ17509.1 YceI family protein [Pontibacter sp. G13]
MMISISAWIATLIALTMSLEPIPLHITQESSLSIQGTSTIHDWEVKAKSVEGNWSLPKSSWKRPKAGKDAGTGWLSLKVNDLQGSQEALNTKMYEAFKYRQFPVIAFELTEGTFGEEQGGEWPISFRGTLRMAGASQPIEIQAKWNPNTGKLRATQSIDMTEFGMTPPSAMFGSIQCGKKVMVSLNLDMTPASQ